MTTERAVEVEPTIAVRVDVSVRRVVNLATASCGVPIVDAVRLENLGPARIVGARWYGALDPHGASISVPLPTVHPGEEVTVAPIGLELSAERLAAVRQAEPARLDWWIGVDRREIARGDAVVDVLPFDEWPGDRAPPGVLAAFVLPDDPVVATLVRRIDGRATEPGRPSARIEALCDSIRALGIRATEPPASFEQRGLRLRLPDAILRDQKANRVELGLLIASCLERMGIPPLVVSSAGRLLPGAWLGDERFPEGVVLDAVRLRAAAASDQLVVLDPELGLADPTVPAAVRAGPEALDDAAFRFAIDIRVARGDHWRPLVGRPRPDLRDDGTVRPIVREILAEAATLPVQAPVRPGEGAVDEPVAARFRQWKERLLDLSLRNRLLAFRSTAKTTVPLDVPDLARFVDRLLADAVLAVEPRRGVFDGEPTEVDDGLGDAPTEEATAPTAPRAIPAATEPLPVAATAPDANDANDDLDETTDRMDPIPPDPDDSTVVAKAVYRRGHVDEGELVEASDAGELVDPELPTAATDTMVTATLATATMSTGTMSTGTMSTATMTPGTMATATMAPATSVPDPSDVDADVGRPRTRLDRGAVHAELDETELLARVVALDRATRLDLEEGGANTLYAAVGFLQWSESGPGEATRLAPLLLIPVSLELQRTARRVRIRRAPEDPIANVTLVEKLRRDFDVDLSAIVAFESEDHAMDVTAVLAAARAAIAPIKGWRIVERVALGQLLFTKFLVWRDLEDNAGWLLESPVVQHLARRVHGPYPNPVDATSPTELDDLVPPQVLPLVLDADSTQMAAIHSALQGRSFVLQGPPGTGKSQTIANLVAVAIATGRTVLVVAEKMAALEVVHRRLKEVGLGEYCLELHSHKANKRAVVATLAAALKRELSASAPPWDARSAELGELRTQLDAYVRALHAGRALGATFFETTGRMLAARSAQVGVGRLELPDDDPRSGGPLALTDDRWRATVDCAAMFATAAAEVEPIADHPWADSRAATWSASGEQAVLARLAKASEATDAVEQAGAALAELLGASVPDVGARIVDLAALATTLAEGPLPPPATDPRTAGPFAERVHEFASLYATWQARSRSVATRWHPGIYKVPLERLVARFGSWAYTWFPIAWLGLFFARRELRAHARKGLPDNRTIAADLNLALQIEQMREPLANQRKALLTAAAGTWSGDEAAGVGALTALTDRADKVRDQIRRVRLGGTDLTDQVLQFVDPALPPDRRKLLAKRAGDATRTLEKWTAAVASLLDAVDAVPTEIPHDEQPFAEIRARLARWRDGAARFRGWALYGEAAARMDNAGLAPVVEAHRGGALAAAAVPAVVEASVLGRWIDAVRDAEPALRGFAGPEHHRKVGRFRAIDQQHLELGVAQVAWAVAQRVPRVGAEVADTSEPGILLREAAKKTRQKSIRRLFQEIPNLLARLEPCLLMSPLSVAQYLPAGGRRFDLVVFDEASQIGTHDAIGALARGGQVVVVGDSRQLPPTTFFQRAGGDDAPDDNDFDELESILDEAVAAGIPEQMLGWHYRSRHETLIRFSNDHYYDGRLAVFPAARKADDLGLTWHPVPNGVYDKSRTRTNRAEARALVEHLVATLVRTDPADRTFGVVTFSQAQQALVSDLLDEARRLRPEIERHFAGVDEPVFVKNLENVQGDERDEILFSIGYGPDERGRVWMNFGPLNREGGERRLNVAVTRARRQLRVFSTLTHDQIDLGRTRARGARHLREFLRYAAEHGARNLARPRATHDGRDFDSPFERAVYDALLARGYEVDPKVGCGAYRIDLAVHDVRNPGEYLLGIELDGPSYHTGATARDRDRLRPQVLEGLGWRLHRIWSTDWWFDREREEQRLERALADAESGEGWADEPTDPGEDDAPELVIPPAKPEPERYRTERYVYASPAFVSDDPKSLHDADQLDALRRVVQEVIDVEAPLHVAELTRRVGAAFGVLKVTAKAQRRVVSIAKKLSPPSVVRDTFVWRAGEDPATYDRVRGPAPDGTLREAEHLPPEEVAAAAAIVLTDNLAMPHADLVRETARLFGLSRMGRKIAEGMAVGIAMLVDRGRAEVQGDRVVGKP